MRSKTALFVVSLFLFAFRSQDTGDLAKRVRSLEQLFVEADLVVYGKVESVIPRSNDNGHKIDYLEVVVVPYTNGVLKGEVIEKVQYQIAGAIKIAVGEEALAFLHAESNGVRVLVGLERGHFRVGNLQAKSAWENGNLSLWTEREARLWGIGKSESPEGPVPLTSILKAIHYIVSRSSSG